MSTYNKNGYRLFAEIISNLNKRKIVKIFLLLSFFILLISNLSLCQKTSVERDNMSSNEKAVGKISVINKNWQQNGIFEGKTPQQEILDKRSEYTKKFQRNDGQVDVIIGGPFHYKDASGAWQDLDLKIQAQTHPKFSYYNNQNNFTSQFAKNANDGVAMEYKNKAISFGSDISLSAENWAPANSSNQTVQTNENVIKYKNIFDNVDLEYELNTGMIEHRMMFNNRNVFSGLSSQQFIDIDEIIDLPAGVILVDSFGTISNNRVTKGNIYVITKVDTLFTILPSRAWDATFNGDALSSEAKADEIIFTQTFITFLSANKIKYSAKIPVKWLLAENRIFPIIFDPPVSIGGTGVLIYGSGWGFQYPWRTNNRQIVSQSIYPQSDINTAGNITKIAYRQGTNNGLLNSNATIKMQTANYSTFSSTNFIQGGWTTCLPASTLDDYRIGSGTAVNCSNPNPVWRTIDLTPFNYNNTQNLIIETRFLNSGFSGGTGTCGGVPGQCCSGGGWYFYNRSGTVMIHGRCDCTGSYPTPETTYNSRTPVIQLTITPINTISGTITNATTGAAMIGVSVSATGLSSTTTNNSGIYSFTVASGYSGTVTPSFGGFAFNPVNRPFSNVTSNQTSQNFSGTSLSSLNYLDIANLRIYADNIPASGNPRIISGNIYIVPKGGCNIPSRVLKFGGNVTVNLNANTISGNGLIYCTNIGSLGQIDLYNGIYSLSAVNDVLYTTSLDLLSMLYRIAGLNLTINNMQVICNGIKIDSKIYFPNILKYYGSSASVVPNITSLYLTTSGVDLSGGINLSNLKITQNLNLEYLNVDYNSLQNELNGSTRFHTEHFKINADIGLKSGRLDKIGLGASSVTSAVPIFNTGLAIDSIGGGLENMNSSEPLNLYFGARIAPYLPYGVALPSLGNLVLHTNYKLGTSFNGWGKFSLFGRETLGVGFTLNPGMFELSGDVNILNTITGHAGLSISRLSGQTRFRGNFNANFKIPTINSPWWLTWLNNLYPAGSTIASTGNYLTNNWLAGTGKIYGLPRIFYFLDWQNGWTFDYGRSSSIIPIEAQTQLGAFRTNGGKKIYSFNLETSTENVIVSARGISALPQLSIYLSNGDSVNYTNYMNHSNVKYITNLSQKVATIIISNPPPGTYYTWSPDVDSIIVIKENQAPKIVIKNVINNSVTKKLVVDYLASDPDNEAFISFGLDNNKYNANGFILADSISENNSSGTIVLDYSNIKSGNYHLYGIITDSIGQNTHFYFDSLININSESGAPNKPLGLAVTGLPNSLVVSFNKNNSLPLNYLLYYTSDLSIITKNSQNISLGDTNRIELLSLPAGKQYQFAISAIDTSGKESDLSTPVTINWIATTVNNYPTFNRSNIIRKVRTGNSYTCNIRAIDPDNDALTYSIVRGPVNAQINGTGVLSWSPTSTNLGYNQFYIKVDDSRGGFDSLFLEVLVYNSESERSLVTFNKSHFMNVSDKAIIEVIDPMITEENYISNIPIRVFSTSDPVGIIVPAHSSSSSLSAYTTIINFTSSPSSSGTLHVLSSDTIWASYISNYSTKESKNYAYFNYIKSDFAFKNGYCVSDSVQFYNASKGIDLKYSWNFGDGTTSTQKNPKHIYKKEIGVGSVLYTVRLIVKNSQESFDTLYKPITVYKIPKATISPNGPTTFCAGNSVTLSAGTADSFLWSTGVSSPSIIVRSSGTYRVLISNGNVCFGADSVIIKVLPLPIVNAGNDILIEKGGRIYLGGSPASGSGPFSYKWSPSIGLNADSILKPIASPNSPTTYRLTVIDAKGCRNYDDVTVNVIGLNLYPNPAINVVFLRGNNVSNGNYTITLLNTIGQIISEESVNVPESIMNKEIRLDNLPSGTYFIRVKGKDRNEVFKFIKGGH